jgi:hypothetical protein
MLRKKEEWLDAALSRSVPMEVPPTCRQTGVPTHAHTVNRKALRHVRASDEEVAGMEPATGGVVS